MRFINQYYLVCCRSVCVAFAIMLLLGVTACGSATPTRPPASPTFLQVQPSPTSGPPPAPTVPPTATGAPPPTATLVNAPVTPTPTEVAQPTATRATKPAATPVPTTPRPAGLRGKIAYSVVTEPVPRFYTIWVASVDGSGAHQILTHSRWPSFSPDGARLAYFGMPEGKSEGLYIANADGGGAQLIVAGAGVCCVNWSRDGNWIVYATSGKPNQPGGPISMIKVDGVFKTIVDLRVQGNGPAFSPDGKQIAYSGGEPGTSTLGIVVASADGSGAFRVLTRDNGGNPQWSPDGKRIVYHAPVDAVHRQVFILNADGSGKKQLTSGKGNDVQPVWSRDGGSILWRSDQNSTAWAIFAMNADGANPRRIIPDVPPDRDFWGWESLSVAP